MDLSVTGSGSARVWLARALLVGTALLGLGAALHPMLPPDLTGQLDVIARTEWWRAIHLVMLAGSGLVIVGLWSQLPTDPGLSRRLLLVIFLVIVSGLVLNASNIAFMAQTGPHDAARFMQGNTDAASGFAREHDISLMRARIGNALVALACGALAVYLWRDGRQPSYMPALAALAAIGGIVGVIAFDPSSRGAVAAVALFAVWAAVAAVRTLRGRSASSSSFVRTTAGHANVAARAGRNKL